MRVALLTNIIAPYRIPVFQALAATPGWRLRIFVNAQSEFDRSWSVDPKAASGEAPLDVVALRSASVRRRIRTRGPAAAEQIVTTHVPLSLFAALRRFAPDVVISVELGVRTLLALLCCRLLRVPLVVWTYHSATSATSAGPLRKAFQRALLSRADAVVGMGTQARRVLVRRGVSETKLFDAPNAHDHDACVKALARIDAEAQRRALIRRLGCRPRIALCVGRLVPVKGIAPLLRAWGDLPTALRSDWTLLFVGDGPLEPLLSEAARRGPPGEIVVVPAVEPDEVVGFYAAARLLVFPSLGDNWGLVVNEAFACGLPVVCSRFAGCADDLVVPGKNGWLVDPTERRELTATLADALGSADLETLGVAARSTAERFRPESMAAGLRAAVHHAVGG